MHMHSLVTIVVTQMLTCMRISMIHMLHRLRSIYKFNINSAPVVCWKVVTELIHSKRQKTERSACSTPLPIAHKICVSTMPLPTGRAMSCFAFSASFAFDFFSAASSAFVVASFVS